MRPFRGDIYLYKFVLWLCIKINQQTHPLPLIFIQANTLMARIMVINLICLQNKLKFVGNSPKAGLFCSDYISFHFILHTHLIQFLCECPHKLFLYKCLLIIYITRPDSIYGWVGITQKWFYTFSLANF